MSKEPIDGNRNSMVSERCGASRLWYGLVLTAVLTVLAGCGSGESKVETGNREGILYFGNGTEPQTIDPHVLSGSPEANIARALYEGLVVQNPYTLEIEGGVAERWETSDDGMMITFYLRGNARFSNGDPITAEDFVWSWHRALHPKTGNQLADQLFAVRNAEAFNTGKITDPSLIGVRAVNPHTLEVELEYPDPFALRKLTYIYNAPVHRASIEAHGKMTDRYSKWTRPGNFVGNGPFVLEDWKMNRYVTVRRNPYYWDADNIAIERIVFRPIESANTEEVMFRSGQLHATTDVPNSRVPDYRRQPEKPLLEGPVMTNYFYIFNTRRPPLDDVRVRLALTMAIDRKSIASSVLQDTVIPSANYVPLGMPNYEHATPHSYNPERARQLLAEAGFPGGEGFPDIELIYNTSENHRSVAVAVQQMWKKELNLDIAIANQEWKVYLDNLDEYHFDIARMGWIGNVYPGSMLDRMVTDGLTNRARFSNKRFDEIILREIRQNIDEKTMMELYREAEQILLDEAPLLPIYSYKMKRLVQPSVEGLPPNPGRVFNFKYVKLDPDASAWRMQ
jgi:oligopeptide transport system substrate-binding protein